MSRRVPTSSSSTGSVSLSSHRGLSIPRGRKKIIEQTTSTFESKLEPVIDGPTLQKCEETVEKSHTDHVYDYVLDLVRMARPKEEEPAGKRFD